MIVSNATMNEMMQNNRRYLLEIFTASLRPPYHLVLLNIRGTYEWSEQKS